MSQHLGTTAAQACAEEASNHRGGKRVDKGLMGAGTTIESNRPSQVATAQWRQMSPLLKLIRRVGVLSQESMEVSLQTFFTKDLRTWSKT